MKFRILQSIKTSIVFVFLILIISSSTWIPTRQSDRIRLYTRNHEFDFTGWTADAAWKKFSMFSLGIGHYLSEKQEQKILDDYNFLHERVGELQFQIAEVFSDPNIKDPLNETSGLNNRLKELKTILSRLVNCSFGGSVLERRISC